MPIYEYECQSCGKVQEVLQKVSEAAPEECVACAKGPLVKQMSRTGFILKGTGWYVTDFRGNQNKSNAQPKAESGDGGATSEPSGEKKATEASGGKTASESGTGEKSGSTAEAPPSAKPSPSSPSN